ncbi:MAG: hypothetical protein KGI50_02595 [Patescibacteria group bacterium]|nr:hypothetical protein [Patescibacteria group bacterium]MDE2438599.1 hypothetical protein [Patescibacteria group bacterium]
MHHVAIMNPSWKLIPKIISGEKSIESRWYRTKRTPWNRIKKGDAVFFKNSGAPVLARADVCDIMQFVIRGACDAEDIILNYGKEICLVENDPSLWHAIPRYCILVRLGHPCAVSMPFHINKKGFGCGAAWLTIPDIATIAL